MIAVRIKDGLFVGNIESSKDEMFLNPNKAPFRLLTRPPIMCAIFTRC